MIETYILPAACVMTRSTILPKLTFMRVVRRVTGKAVIWSAFEYAVYMTRLALNICMKSRQWECSFAMIETHIFPRAGIVAQTAIPSKLTLMRVVRRVTGKAVLWRAFEYAIGMATLTVKPAMFAGQREGCLIMIETDVFPIASIMTLGTILPHLSQMKVHMT